MSGVCRERLKRVGAACAAAALLLLALAADCPAPVIHGEGITEEAVPSDVVGKIRLRYWGFGPTIEEILPEWSSVEAGTVVARTRAPQLLDEKAEKQVQVQEAEAAALEAEAQALATLAQIESELLAAQARLDGAKERLAALEAMPPPCEMARLQAEIEENEVQCENAAAQAEVLSRVAEEGLCPADDVLEAERELERGRDRSRYLAAVLAELEGAGESAGVYRCRLEVKKAECDVRIAELRKKVETERQRLLREAARGAALGQARRELDLTERRIEELDIRAPRDGHVLYGYRKWYWPYARGDRPTIGMPLHYGHVAFSMVDPGNVCVAAEVAEADLLNVAPGDAVEITLPAIPGQAYEGVVEDVLPIADTSHYEILETATKVLKRHGIVRVKVQQADEKLRPGMKAEVVIHPSARPAKTEGAEPAPERAGSPILVLRGHLESTSFHYIRCPFQGRIVRIAKTGTLVEVGSTLVELDPGLQVDWRARDESEIERLDFLRQAAEMQVELRERLIEPTRQAAAAQVEMARVDLMVMEAGPSLSERTEAENKTSEAEWQLERARCRLAASRDLYAGGHGSGADVRRAEQRLASAEAEVREARAELAKVDAGASSVELAIARADLDLAQTALQKAVKLAELDVTSAQAEVRTAESRLDAYRAQAQRRLEKAGEGVVKSPVKGIVQWCGRREGEEVEPGRFLMGIADMERAVVYGMLDESDCLRARPGCPARVSLAGVPGRTYPGRIKDIVDWPDVHFYVRQWTGETRVRPGRLFRAVIELDEEPPQCVGMSALVEVFPLPEDAADPLAAESETTSKEGAFDDGSD